MKPITYSDAGVDIDEGDRLIDEIKPLIATTRRKGLVSSLGGYASLFKLDTKKYTNPVIVSTTDGVGTKLKLAFETGIYNTVGIDLVAMCVNDLICCGAEPLFFLDYYATGKLNVDQAKLVIEGITKALAPINCTLAGGETAEMPGFYQPKEFDLAGFAVGVVNEDKIIDGSQVHAGDIIIGLHSSGVHSNGFSLVRKILSSCKINLADFSPELNQSWGEALLTPTLVYVNVIMALTQQVSLKAIAHITGGGLVGNVPRVLPATQTAVFEKNKMPTLPIFKLLQKLGHVSDDEMGRVFNNGIGMVLVVSPKDVSQTLETIQGQGFRANIVGHIAPRTKEHEVLFI